MTGETAGQPLSREIGSLERRIFLKEAKSFSGNYLIDDTYLFENGVRDFDRYRVDPSVDLARGRFFVPDNSVPPVSLTKAL